MSSRLPIQTSPAVRWRLLRERVVPLIVFSATVATVAMLWRSNASRGRAVGIAEGTRSLVTSPQAGILEEVIVQSYEFVEAGQPLAVVRPQDPRSRVDLVQMELEMALAQLQPSLPEENALDYERVRLELLRTQAELAMARVNLIRADNEERRSRPLYLERLVSEDAYDLSLQTRNLYLAEVAAKSNAVVEIQYRLDSLRSLGEPEGERASQDAEVLRTHLEALRAQANTNLASYTLVAPISGMVAAVHRQPGEQVVEGEALLTLTAPESDRIVGYLRQPYAVALQVGQRVRITTREYPGRSFWSEITQVGAQVEVITNSVAFLRFGVLVDSALPFVVQLPSDSGIRPGELVDLAIGRTPASVSPVAMRPPSSDRSAPPPIPDSPEGALVTYTGMCDASAGVALNRELIVVADDEESILRVYDRSRGGSALQVLNLTSFLRRGRGGKEADLEGSARMGDRIYWVSSHGRNAGGKVQTSRYRFFATRVALHDGRVFLQPEGRPYTQLLEDLLREPRLASLDLRRAAGLPPKSEGGLNIEGLCPGPDGSLLLGFRNPVPTGKALVVPLLNPGDLLDGRPARFGPHRLLDLRGHGIRSLEQVEGRYLIVAGSWSGKGNSSLYVWDGTDNPPQPVEAPSLAGLNPEAISVFDREGTPWLHALSDDGTVKVGGVEAKRLQDPTLKKFRGISFALPPTAWSNAMFDPRQRTTELASEIPGPDRSAAPGGAGGFSR